MRVPRKREAGGARMRAAMRECFRLFSDYAATAAAMIFFFFFRYARYFACHDSHATPCLFLIFR